MKFLEKIKKPTMPKISGPDLILTLGTMSLTATILFLLGIPGFSILENRTHLVTVNGNAATLQLAAESYAAQNQGRYPEDPLDLVPFLPRQQAPLNPFLHTDSLFRGAPGDLTYRSPTGGGDYVIQAWGPDDNGQPYLLLTLSGRVKNSQ